MWRSPFVLQTFASHLNFTFGRVEVPNLDTESISAWAAFALAVTAVSHSISAVCCLKIIFSGLSYSLAHHWWEPHLRSHSRILRQTQRCEDWRRRYLDPHHHEGQAVCFQQTYLGAHDCQTHGPHRGAFQRCLCEHYCGGTTVCQAREKYWELEDYHQWRAWWGWRVRWPICIPLKVTSFGAGYIHVSMLSFRTLLTHAPRLLFDFLSSVLTLWLHLICFANLVLNLSYCINSSAIKSCVNVRQETYVKMKVFEKDRLILTWPQI